MDFTHILRVVTTGSRPVVTTRPAQERGNLGRDSRSNGSPPEGSLTKKVYEAFTLTRQPPFG